MEFSKNSAVGRIIERLKIATTEELFRLDQLQAPVAAHVVLREKIQKCDREEQSQMVCEEVLKALPVDLGYAPARDAALVAMLGCLLDPEVARVLRAPWQLVMEV